MYSWNISKRIQLAHHTVFHVFILETHILETPSPPSIKNLATKPQISVRQETEQVMALEKETPSNKKKKSLLKDKWSQGLKLVFHKRNIHG